MNKKSRAQMEREKRAARRSSTLQVIVKRKITTEMTCHYILFPIVPSTIQKSNDFYFHTLRLLWNGKNIFKDACSQKLLRGLHSEISPKDILEIENLTRNEKTGWFASSRKTDLVKIGKLAAYFLRFYACSVGKSLDESFNITSSTRATQLDDLFQSLKNKKTIVPVIIRLEISPYSDFDSERFVCLEEDVANSLFNGEENVLSRRVKLFEIHNSSHDWAWNLLNTTEQEVRREVICKFKNHSIATTEETTAGSNDNEEVISTVNDVLATNSIAKRRISTEAGNRKQSARTKQRNTKYPPELFFME